MRTGFLAVLLFACMAVGLFASHGVYADGSTTSSGTTHSGGACNQWARISHGDVDCLHAWWNNSPPVSMNLGAGSTLGATTSCQNWGTVVAHIDVKDSTDQHIHMREYTRTESWIRTFDVRNISCCINESDLCYKNQVVPENGRVTHIEIQSGSFLSHNLLLNTHQRRYDFCQENPDYIFCTVNHTGDVWIDPGCTADNSCNCGDHFCTEDDCDAAWDNISAVSFHELTSSKGCTASDHDRYVSTIDATDGTSQSCTITAGCGTGRLTNTWDDAGTKTTTTVVNVVQFTADVDDIRGHYNCGGKLKTPNCHGTIVSTHLDEYPITIE